MTEPTIYKPSIYNGNGVYNNGAGGGGGGGNYKEYSQIIASQQDYFNFSIDLTNLYLTNKGKNFYLKNSYPVWGGTGNAQTIPPNLKLESGYIGLYYYSVDANTAFPEKKIYNGNTSTDIGWPNLGNTIEFEIADNTAKINNTNYSCVIEDSYITRFYPFGDRANNSIPNYYGVSFHESKLSNLNDSFVFFHFVPALDLDTNKKGLLDKVTGVFYEVTNVYGNAADTTLIA